MNSKLPVRTGSSVQPMATAFRQNSNCHIPIAVSNAKDFWPWNTKKNQLPTYVTRIWVTMTLYKKDTYIIEFLGVKYNF